MIAFIVGLAVVIKWAFLSLLIGGIPLAIVVYFGAPFLINLADHDLGRSLGDARECMEWDDWVMCGFAAVFFTSLAVLACLLIYLLGQNEIARIARHAQELANQ